MKSTFLLRLPKFLRNYPLRWVKNGFKNLDVTAFIEWALAITVEDFEMKQGGVGSYDTTYADYFDFVTRNFAHLMSEEKFDKELKNNWNLIVSFGCALREVLDMDEINRTINANLDFYRVEWYNEKSGIFVIKVLEEE